jgi:hypothetical protein
MNHLRQQALGNILASLWRGSRLYLNETTAYLGLRRMGFDVRLIAGGLPENGGSALQDPPAGELSRDRELLAEHYGIARVVAETTDLLERLAATSALRRRGARGAAL